MRIFTALPVVSLFLTAMMLAGERKAIAPAGVSTIGPYTPAILTGDYLYISGHVAVASSSVEDQTRTILDRMKTIVAAAGLTMDHVVYTHLFLTDIRDYEAVNKVYATYFPEVKPARVTVGVARLPNGAAVEINAVAVRNLGTKQSVNRVGSNPAVSVPISEGIRTGDRFFLSGTLGRDRETGAVPEREADQVRVSFRRAKDTLRLAGLSEGSLVCFDVYHTKAISRETIQRIWKEEFGSRIKGAVSIVEVNQLALGTNVGVTGVAALDLKQATFGKGCAGVGETLYCAAAEPRRVAAGDVVAVQVYLDDIGDFEKMNGLFGSMFAAEPRPARATVQASFAGRGGFRFAVVLWRPGR